MNKKSKSILLLATCVISAITVSVVSLLNYSSDIFSFAESIKYEINFNSGTNKFHGNTGSTAYSGDATVHTELGNNITFAYSDAMGLTSTWHVFKNSGYFYNKTPIHGMSKLKMEFRTENKEYKIQWSNTTDFSDDESVSRTFVSSMSTPLEFDFDGNNPAYFKFTNISGNNLNVSSMSINFSCVNSQPIFNLQSSDEELGTVSGPSGVINAGTPVTISATPKSGAAFVGWYNEKNELVSSLSTYSFNMPYDDIRYTGRFEWILYSVDVTYDNTMGSVSGQGHYKLNDEVILTATPNEEHSFVGWYQNEELVSEESSIDFVMGTSDVSYYARFVEGEYRPTLIISSNDELKGTVNGPSGIVIAETSVTIIATANDGANFIGWYSGDDLVSSLSTYTFEMPYHDVNYVAHFAWIGYSVSLTINDPLAGSVSGQGEYSINEVVTITATPNENYVFEGWFNTNGYCVFTESQYSFHMANKDVTYEARFYYSYAINVIPEGDDDIKGFVIYPSRAVYDEFVTVTAYAYDGYEFDYWYDDDFNELGYESTYEFDMPLHDVTIHPAYKKADQFLTYSYSGEVATVIGHNSGLPTSLYIPEYVSYLGNRYKVTSIGSKALFECESLVTISIPSTVVSVGNYAFFGCSSLSSLTINNGVETVGIASFANCSSLSSIYFSETLTSIGEGAFAECFALKTLDIPDSVLTIAAHAFEHCRFLATLVIGDGVTTIDEYAFNDCPSLRTVTVGENVTNIKDCAFGSSYCKSAVKEVINKSALDIKVNYSTYGNISKYAEKVVSSSEDQSVFLDANGFVTYFDGEKTHLIDYVGGSTDIVIPDNVDIIGESLFKDNNEITSILVGSNVRTIEGSAFTNCTNLQSIDFLGVIETVGTSAFEGCTGLTSIDFWYGMLSIGIRAFYQCINLEAIDIPDTVTFIGNEAFCECESLLYVDIPAGLTTIEESTFDCCKSIVSINIPNSVTSIKEHAFGGCSTLAKVTLGSGVKSIGTEAFRSCTYLYEIINKSTLPLQVGQTYQYYTYGYITAYAKQIVTDDSDSKVSIEDDGFIIFEDGSKVTLVKYFGSNPNVVIPDNITCIGDFAFDEAKCGLLSVDIPDSVIEIEAHSFRNNKYFTSVTLGAGVKTIGYSAFIGCSKLYYVFNKSSLNLAPRTTSYGYVACYTEKVLTPSDSTGLVIVDGFVTWDNGSDVYCLNYIGNDTNIVIPDNVTLIHNYCFARNNKIESVTIPNSVKQINGFAFNECRNLRTINFPTTNVTLANSVFNCCTSLTDVTIPSNVKLSGEFIFSYCSSLTNVTFANGRTSLGNWMFNQCNSLVSVSLPSTLTTINPRVFNECASLESVTIPNSVTTIGAGAFGSCVSLISVNLNNGLQTIGDAAFSYCYSLSSITLPSTLTEIKSYAFSSCYSLAEVINLSSLSLTIGSDTNGYVASNARYISNSLTPSRINIDDNGVVTYNYGGEVVLLKYCGNKDTVYLPNTITEISQYAFYNPEKGVRIMYAGTKAEWNSINKVSWYSNLYHDYTKIEAVFCLDGCFVVY